MATAALALACWFCSPVDCLLAAPAPAKPPLNVRDFGAAGDGQTKDTAALQKALDACAAAGGGIVLLPRGHYLIGSVVLGANTTLQLEASASLCGSPDPNDYPVVRVRWEGEFSTGHRALLSASNAANVSVVGPGAILGPPLPLSSLRHPRGPVLLEFNACTNILLEGFSTLYQRLWSIHPVFCRNFTARNLTVRSILANGDGIDIDSCRDVLIEHCHIDTGDDAISLKSGRGLQAASLAASTENVLIRDCSLISSIFAGLGLGTEMSGGIRHVRLENCFISGRQNAIFIKSRDGRGGFMEDISGEDLMVRDSGTFLGIDLETKGIQASDPVPGSTNKLAQVRNLAFDRIQVSNIDYLIRATNVPPERLLEGLALSRVSGTCAKGMALANMRNVTLSRIAVAGFKGPLLTLENVEGKGLKNPARSN